MGGALCKVFSQFYKSNWSIYWTDLNYQCYGWKTIWIETEVIHERNVLFRCVCRHPKSAMNSLTKLFSSKTIKDSRTEKLSSFSCNDQSISFQWYFPSKLKVAKVVPIFKKAGFETTNKYSSHHLWRNLKKHEKLIDRKIYVLLKDHNILYSLHFWFQENNSMDHVFFSMPEEFRSSFDIRRYGCGIFMNLQKGFDPVNRHFLLTTLEHWGITGNLLDWFIWIKTICSSKWI